ncbi:MAG: VOC family protein [Desulfofustis sp.]|nr:VOC family protein [Desulfofustis sp.]
MKTNPVIWFEIYVQDMTRAKTFYEQVLAVQLTPLPGEGMEMLTFPMIDNSPGAMGALVKMDGCPSGGNSTLVYFACEDCAIEAARAEKAGGKTFKEKFSIGEYGFIALVFDPDGNMIGLHSMH